MRIDAHSHGMHAERDAQGRLRPPLVAAWRPGQGDPQELVRQHRERGIERVLVLDPAEIAFELQRIFGDFVIPVPMVDPDRIGPAEIDRLLSQGARGIKFIAPMHSYGDNRYADFSGGTALRRALNLWREMFAPNGRLDTAAVAKLCFASDVTHFTPERYDYLPYIEFYERFYEALQVPAELRQRVDRENILALTGG